MQFLCKPPLNGCYESRFFSLIGLRSIFEKPWRVRSVKAITSLTPANGAAGLLLATPASSPASISSKYWVQWCHCNSALSVQKSTMKRASKARCIHSNLCDPTISFIRVERSPSRFNAAKQREVSHRQGALQHSIFRMRKGTEALLSFSVTPSLPVSVMQLC